MTWFRAKIVARIRAKTIARAMLSINVDDVVMMMYC